MSTKSGKSSPSRFLKPATAALVLLCLITTGCARRYNVTLTNGHTITAYGKPKFDKATGGYTFKDAKGQEVRVPGFKVKEIAAPGTEEKVDFGPVPPRVRRPQ